MRAIAGLGARLRASRERLAWTREALAFHSGLSWSAIAQIESGRRTNVRPGTLAALARPLGVSIDYLVGGSWSRPPMLEHALFSYGSEDQFQATIGSFLSEGIDRSDALIAVTTPANAELLRDHLGGDARSVEFIDSSAFLSTPIAALEAFRGFCDAKLASGATWVRIVGEPIWERSEPDVRLWTRYESLLNLILGEYPLTAVCPYDERSVAPEILTQAHLTHPHKLGSNAIVESHDYIDPARFALENR
jgi:transcriptional regulator with XRE-family HTH domain